MSSLGAALDVLAAREVDGGRSYGLGATPGALSGAQLPALVIAPEWGRSAGGLEPNPFAAGHGEFTVEVVHALIVSPAAAGLGPRGALPAVVVAADAVIAALAANPDLDGTLARPLRCAVTLGIVPWAGVDYHGALFRHTWTLRI